MWPVRTSLRSPEAWSPRCSCALAGCPHPQLQEGHLLVRHFQFLRWSAYRDTPDSKKAFLRLLAEVDRWQAESGDGRTVVHCL